jgi:hypothetical protein
MRATVGEREAIRDDTNIQMSKLTYCQVCLTFSYANILSTYVKSV